MIKDSNYIKNRLLKKYPNLEKENIWLTDHWFLFPELEDLKESIERNSVKDIIYNKNISECEEFSLFLCAKIKMERAINAKDIKENERYSWAFGEAIGYKNGLQGRGIHQMNICFTEEGLKIIEPQSDKIESFDLDKFNIFFVKM